MQTSSKPAAPDQFPTAIDIYVEESRQLFDTMDPAPLRERELDSRVETFIVDSAKDLPRNSDPSLVVHLSRAPDGTEFLPDTIRRHFDHCARSARRRLREHFRYGRVALCIGLSALSFALGASIIAEHWLNFGGLNVIKESLGIAGWVAMWRPAEVFLYDWWPIRNDAQLYERLAAMPVQIKIRS